MMKLKTTKIMVIIMSPLCVSIFLLSSFKQTNPWKAPDEADKLVNPLAGNAEATAKGKTLYMTNCAVCHGNKGKGDGAGGKGLNPKAADYSSQKVQSQTDGAIFWKITNGKSPMPAYKNLL